MKHKKVKGKSKEMAEQTQQLAEKLARFIENESGANDFEFLKTEIGKINSRLEKIENNLISQNSESENPNPKPAHPSQNRFARMLADEIIENLEKEKPCPYEPAGKVCDNCSMCSSLGY